MLQTTEFGASLKKLGFDFYSGVPCSFLKDLINYAMTQCTYYAASNEGDAVAVCAGAALSGRKSVVLLQNSGLGNTVSPLTSLNYCFQLPVLGFVSLRGELGIPDEPQHELMGQITTDLLDTMRISWAYLSSDLLEANHQLKEADRYLSETQLPFFFVVKKNTFDSVPYDAAVSTVSVPLSPSFYESGSFESLTRLECLDMITAVSSERTFLLATTGKTGRELFEVSDRAQNFYQVGSMGCISAVGLGLSVCNPDKQFVVIDGDGAALMRLGNFPMVGHYKPSNLLHILLDNGVHDSTGGQLTVSSTTDFTALALASGYLVTQSLCSLSSLKEAILAWQQNPVLTFLHVRISVGSKSGLGRPTVSPVDVKKRFMEALSL